MQVDPTNNRIRTSPIVFFIFFNLSFLICVFCASPFFLFFVACPKQSDNNTLSYAQIRRPRFQRCDDCHICNAHLSPGVLDLEWLGLAPLKYVQGSSGFEVTPGSLSAFIALVSPLCSLTRPVQSKSPPQSCFCL